MNIEAEIESILVEFTQANKISWREQQRETVEKICSEVIKGTSDIILDAPVGTGKSLIAMASSYVLRDLDKTGYLLCSDLELQNQYEDDLQRYRVGIPSVRGSDNYICDDNGQRVSFGTCNLKKYNKKLLNCYYSCGYYSDRDRAIAAPFSLLNYSYWLVQMNYVNLRHGLMSFEPRDVCFLDEAHKLDMIIHNHFAPRLNNSLITSINNVENIIKENSAGVQLLVNQIKKSNSNVEIIKLLGDLKTLLLQLTLSIKGYLERHRFGKTPTAQEILSLNSFDRIKDVFCKVQDFEELVVEDPALMTKTVDNDEISLNYLDSQRMLSVFFQRYTKQRVFMSATWGNIKKSSEFIGINSDFAHLKIDNNFNWNQSKYQVVGKNSLTWNNRDAQLLKAIGELDKVLEKYPNKRGLIHTGSYSFSDAILTHSKFRERFTQYRSSEEKKRALLQHKMIEDSVILGPSLLEGINLPDDQCDFIIFFKCPYLGLGSDFVNKKAQLYPEWYLWKTALSIEQGCGRGMRHKDDKCDVWFIDQSFIKFFHQNSKYMSSEFLDRTLDPIDKMLL